MLVQIRKYKVVFAIKLIAVLCISAFAKDLHEILVDHQHVSCFDQPDNSFKHYHSTEHSLHDCKISQFVFAPVIFSDPVVLTGKSIQTMHESVYSHVQCYVSNQHSSYPSRGPPAYPV